MGFARWCAARGGCPRRRSARGGSCFGLAFLSPWLIADDRAAVGPRSRSTARGGRKEDLPDIDVRVEHVREWTNAPNAYALGLATAARSSCGTRSPRSFPRSEVRVVLAHEPGHTSTTTSSGGCGGARCSFCPSASSSRSSRAAAAGGQPAGRAARALPLRPPAVRAHAAQQRVQPPPRGRGRLGRAGGDRGPAGDGGAVQGLHLRGPLRSRPAGLVPPVLRLASQRRRARCDGPRLGERTAGERGRRAESNAGHGSPPGHYKSLTCGG